MKSKNKQIRFKTLLAACVCIIALRASAGTFDFVVQTTTANQAFAFQTDNASGFNIDWGDGQTQTGLSGTALRSHNYAVPGVYTNKVAGTATRIAFGGTGTTPLLLRDILSPIDEGVTGINSTAYMFWGAENVERFTRADWFDTASTNVVNTMYMVNGMKKFNQPIGDWAVSNVTRTSYMFYNAVNFNQDISGWDVGKVTQMDRMFYGAKTFNQPIGDWNVRNVTTMQSMFDGATAFKQDLSGWTVSNVGNFANFLNRVTLPTDYYNSLLIRWSKQNLKTGVDFNGGSSQYDLGKPDVCRESMIDTFGWTIADGGSTGKWYAYEPGVISFQ